jgi:hypothetical protein
MAQVFLRALPCLLAVWLHQFSILIHPSLNLYNLSSWQLPYLIHLNYWSNKFNKIIQ